jgi:hypothetical protein
MTVPQGKDIVPGGKGYCTSREELLYLKGRTTVLQGKKLKINVNDYNQLVKPKGF